MPKKSTLLGTLIGLGFLLGAISGAIAAESETNHTQNHNTPQTNQFQRLEQPLSHKIIVTVSGLGLIGLELWWFLLSKPKSRQATTTDGIQEVTVTVDGGYEPSQIIVQTGQPVRLNFDRKDPSSCLEEIRIPHFQIAQELPLNQVTAIEFTPKEPGQYEFTCGMNMFRGLIKAQATAPAPIPTATPQPLPTAVTALMTPNGSQEATITVARGYEPKRVIVEVGYPVRLQIDRHNPSSCYDQLLIPEFDIAVDLEPGQITTIEFIPKQPGEYEFMCGMRMNRGVIEVRASQPLPSSKNKLTQTHIHS